VLLLSPHCHGLRSSRGGISDRKVGEAFADNLALVANPAVGTETVIDVDEIAKEIDESGIDPKKLMVETLKIWANLFRSGNITRESVALASWNTLGVAAKMAHPLLGTAFTMITKLFGIGTNPDNQLVEQILEMVSKMINQALTGLEVNFAQREFAGAMRAVRYGPNTPDHVAWYAERQMDLISSAPHIFPHCLRQSAGSLANEANISSDACTNWQKNDVGGGGMRALLLEIQWVNLHIQLAGVFAVQKNTYAWNIAQTEIAELQNIIQRHYDTYRRHRAGRSTTGTFTQRHGLITIFQGKDTILDERMTGPNCRATNSRFHMNTYGRRRATRNFLRDEFAKCQREWDVAMQHEMFSNVYTMINGINTWVREARNVRLS